MPAITNVNELQNISLDLAGNYWLANDIDASGFGFVPLGIFTGTLDGKNHKITDFTITINAAGIQEGALFEENQGAITNLGLEDCAISVTSTNNAARACALVIDNRGTILGCWSTGTISATCNGATAWGNGAGLVCINNMLGDGGTLDKCYSSVDVTVTSQGYAVAAGLVAINYGDISESYANGDISATSSSGTRNVYVGGLVGENGYNFADYEGIITDSYARGNATATGGGTAYAGGLVAVNEHASSTITDSYSTGIPAADDTDGGLCALNNGGAFTDCFWDTQTSGTAVSDGGTGKTTSQMKTKSTFTSAGWDFIIIWFINGITNDGYPFHFAMPPEPLPDAPRATVAVEDKIALECVRNIEMAAGGRFRIDEEGNAVYKSRYARNA